MSDAPATPNSYYILLTFFIGEKNKLTHQVHAWLEHSNECPSGLSCMRKKNLFVNAGSRLCLCLFYPVALTRCVAQQRTISSSPTPVGRWCLNNVPFLSFAMESQFYRLARFVFESLALLQKADREAQTLKLVCSIMRCKLIRRVLQKYCELCYYNCCVYAWDDRKRCSSMKFIIT